MEDQICEHLSAIKALKQPKDYVCEECVKTHSRWMHLRTCQTCGVTLCCDSSPNQHASKHARADGHPVVISAEPGERWLWCYVDEEMADY
ncbi:MAG: UBP-type zinc finger domain-containing protein [Mucilaginibacter sp.]